MHADNFINVALGIPRVYNEIQQIPQDVNQLILGLGIDLNRAFRNPFEARLSCFNGSRIANQKNRMLLRLPQENTGGGFWMTFDTNSQFAAQKNCFDFPLFLVGQARFQFDASEIIFEKDNGLQAYALYNAQGLREEEAPADVVRNVDSPFDAIIKNGLDCSRCHNGGILPAVDGAKRSFLANAAEHDPNDVELVRVLYANNDANQAIFTADNNRLVQVFQQLDILPTDPDPINLFSDDQRRDWTLQDAAGFMATMGFVSSGVSPAEDFCQKLNGSANGRAQLGQLCEDAGATVTFNQFKDTFLSDLVRDFRLGLDPIDQ